MYNGSISKKRRSGFLEQSQNSCVEINYLYAELWSPESCENVDDREIAYKLRFQHFRAGPLSDSPCPRGTFYLIRQKEESEQDCGEFLLSKWYASRAFNLSQNKYSLKWWLEIWIILWRRKGNVLYALIVARWNLCNNLIKLDTLNSFSKRST